MLQLKFSFRIVTIDCTHLYISKATEITPKTFFIGSAAAKGNLSTPVKGESVIFTAIKIKARSIRGKEEKRKRPIYALFVELKCTGIDR